LYLFCNNFDTFIIYIKDVNNGINGI